MTGKGKEPAAFNFVDLTPFEDGNDVKYASTSAVPVERKPLLTPMAPVVNPNEAGTSRATLDYIPHPPTPQVYLQQPPAPQVYPQQPPAQEEPRSWLRGQSSVLRHPERSRNIFNRGNDGHVRRSSCPTQGICGDRHCRAYLGQQGGLSEARRRRRLEPRLIQPATSHDNSDMMQQQAIPPNQQQAIPLNQQQAIPPNQQQAIPPNQQQAIPPNQQQAIPPNQQQAIPQDQQQAIPQDHQQAIPQNQQQAIPQNQQQAILQDQQHQSQHQRQQPWIASILALQAEHRMHLNPQQSRDSALLDLVIKRRYESAAKAHFYMVGRRRGP